jgi:hypothetical protein
MFYQNSVTVEKKLVQKFGPLLQFKKLPKEIIRSIVETWPYLVTLLPTFRIFPPLKSGTRNARRCDGWWGFLW